MKLSKLIRSHKINEDWRDGFKDPSDPNTVDTPLRLMTGENPFTIHGKKYVYVWDEDEGDIVVYDFSTDMTIPYMDFQERIGMLKECRRVSLKGFLSIL
jgi:hypothetical protein